VSLVLVFLSLVFLSLLTCADRFVKTISIYTLKTLCFSEAGQIDDKRVHKRKLRHSLIVVACLWTSLGLLVAINMAVDGGRHQFYGPAGYCEFSLRC
jgi:hypothetical protein